MTIKAKSCKRHNIDKPEKGQFREPQQKQVTNPMAQFIVIRILYMPILTHFIQA